jgi:hypothetical protein
LNRLLVILISLLLLVQIALTLYVLTLRGDLSALNSRITSLERQLSDINTYMPSLINQSLLQLVNTLMTNLTYPSPSFIIMQKLDKYILLDLNGTILLESMSADKVIQRAIDELYPKNGGLIIIKPGVYVLSEPIVLKSKIFLVGEGYPEVVASRNNDGVIIAEDSSYVVIEKLKIRGSRDSTSGALLRVKKHGFTLRIRDVELYNHYDGIVIEGADPPRDFWGIIIEGIHVHDVSNVGLTVDGYGNVLYVKESNIAYSGNTCILLKDTGDGVMEFMNVHCFNSGKYSVHAYNTDARPVQHKRFIACHLEGIDMRPQTSRFVNCINIAFVDVEIAGMLGNGIEFINCRDVRFYGGRIINNGIGSPGKYAGIYIKDSRNIIVSNVFIYDFNPPGSKTQAYGILEDGYSDYNIFANNILQGNAISGIRSVGTHTITIGNIV